jgi:hypothetical protein
MQKEETITHLFMKCDRAHIVWFGSSLGIKFDNSHTNFIDWLYYCLTTRKEEDLCYLAAIIMGSGMLVTSCFLKMQTWMTEE